MAATNRTLQTLAVVESERLTPHELGQVLDNTAAAVVPDVGLDEEPKATVVVVDNVTAQPTDLQVTPPRSTRTFVSPDIVVEVGQDMTDGSSEVDTLLATDMRLDEPVGKTCYTSDR
jgi:hypothetical protein